MIYMSGSPCSGIQYSLAHFDVLFSFFNPRVNTEMDFFFCRIRFCNIRDKIEYLHKDE